MKITYELDDATDSQSDITMMAHVRDYAVALFEIDQKIRSKLKYCDVHAYGDGTEVEYGKQFIDTVESLRKKNEELIELLEEVRSDVNSVTASNV